MFEISMSNPFRPTLLRTVILSLLLCLSFSTGRAHATSNRHESVPGGARALLPMARAGSKCFEGSYRHDHSCFDRVENHELLYRDTGRPAFSRRRGISGHHKHGGHHRHWVHHRRPHPRRRQRETRGRRRRRRRTPPPPKVRESRQNAAFNVMDFGAAGDGVTNDTQAFLDAWQGACHATGTALLAVPSGRQFLVGPFLLLDGTYCTASISMMVNGEIVAPEDPALWGPDGDSKWIYIHDITNFILTSTGGGTINGRGQTWWDQHCKRNPSYPCVSRPRAITFKRSTNVVVTGLSFLDSQAMHLDFDDCDGVYVADLTISAPGDSPNTDGIHLQNSVNAVVERCTIGTGDDCISIQTGCTNILNRDISCGPGHGISIGGLGKDNSYAVVSNVQVYNVTFSGSTNGLRIKTWQGASGSVNNVTYTMVEMNAVWNPIIVDQYYCDSDQPCENQTSAVKISNVLYNNIWGTSASNVAVNLACSVTQPCENVVLQDIDLTLANGQSASTFCQNVVGTARGTVQPASCLNT